MITAPPLAELEPLLEAALSRPGPDAGDEDLHQLVATWALELRARGESRGGTHGAILGVTWRTLCAVARRVPGYQAGRCEAVHDQIDRWIGDAVGPIESRARGTR